MHKITILYILIFRFLRMRILRSSSWQVMFILRGSWAQ